MRDKRAVTGAAVLSVASLWLAGCGQASTQAPAPVAAAQSTPPTAGSTAAPVRDDVAPVATTQQAIKTAAAAVPNGRVFDVEIESAQNQHVFDLKVASNGAEFEVVVDAAGTKVVSQRQVSQPSDDVAKVQAAKIDAVQAIDAASKKEPGADFSELEIDKNAAGTVIWQVEMTRPDGTHTPEYDVDAQTGEVIGTGPG